MPLGRDRRPRIVIEKAQFRTPIDRCRKARMKADRKGGPQGLRPGRGAAQRGGFPIMGPNEIAQFAASRQERNRIGRIQLREHIVSSPCLRHITGRARVAGSRWSIVKCAKAIAISHTIVRPANGLQPFERHKGEDATWLTVARDRIDGQLAAMDYRSPAAFLPPTPGGPFRWPKGGGFLGTGGTSSRRPSGDRLRTT